MNIRSWKQIGLKNRLGENQRKLYKQLIDFHEKVGKELADIYQGAIKAISETSNPDRLAQTAHSCRELMSVFKIKIFRRRGYSISKEDIKSVLNEMDPSGNPPNELIEALQISWPKLYGYFSKIAHHESKSRPNVFSERFEELESTFLILTQPSIQTFDEIDKLIRRSPTLKNVDEAIKRLKNNVLADHFYEKVNVTWLMLLEKAGVFRNPPNAIIEDKTIRFPPWPQVKLLLRATETQPKKVFNIMKNCRLLINRNQLNIHILENFIDCAIKMPPQYAKNLFTLINTKKWSQCLYYFFLPEKLADLSEYLASKGEIKSALHITEILLDVTIDDSEKINNVADRNRIVWQEAKPYYELWEFEHIIKNKTKVLREKAPERLIEIVCKKLAKAIFLNLKQHRKKDEDDSSYVWRQQISYSAHYSDDIRDVFIDTINELIQTIGKKQPSELTKSIEIFKSHKYLIFRRIEIYTYSLFLDNFKKEIGKTLTNADILYDDKMQNEYLNLLEKAYAGLETSTQNKILTLIENRPREKKKYKNYWQLQYLHRIKNHLPSALNEKYNQYLSKYGEPHYDEWTTRIGVGPTSPLSVDDLENMVKANKSAGIVEYLKTWKSSNETYEEPSPEGLGRNLEELIKKYPEEFSKNALLFYDKKIRPVYIYHFFSGLCNAVKEKKMTDWHCIIELAKKIIFSKNLFIFELSKDEMEPDWDSVYLSIVKLIRDGLFAAHNISFDKRNDVWTMLEKLSSHKEPDFEYEQKCGGDNMDPATMSVNTIRGEVIHTIIDYALWCAMNLKQKILVEEAKKILETHLDLRKEPSLTIRAVYGWRLPNIVYLDARWVENNIKKIFPSAEDLKKLWLAAFESYLANRVHEDVFPILKNEYLKAISYSNWNEESRRKSFVDIRERLHQHLMIAYAYDLADDDIVDTFFKQVPSSAKADAIEFIGKEILKEKNLNKSKKPNIEKMKSLIEKRMRLGDKEELKMFGWWFIHSPHDKKWSIQVLHEIISQKTDGEIEPVNEVIEKFREYINIEPILVSRCLYIIMERDKKGLMLYYKRKALREIILALQEKRNEKIKKDTRKMINKLVERGHLEFKDLVI
jgi:hypothetical protein